MAWSSFRGESLGGPSRVQALCWQYSHRCVCDFFFILVDLTGTANTGESGRWGVVEGKRENQNKETVTKFKSNSSILQFLVFLFIFLHRYCTNNTYHTYLSWSVRLSHQSWLFHNMLTLLFSVQHGAAPSSPWRGWRGRAGGLPIPAYWQQQRQQNTH